MHRHVLASLCLFLSLVLAACGGGSGSDSSGSSTPTSTVSSNVVKGIIDNGIIKAWRWENGAYVQVGSAATDVTGHYSLSLSDHAQGLVRLDLTISTDPANPTRMRCDAAKCGNAAFGDWVTLTTNPGLSTWAKVAADGTVTVMPMTPVSTLLVRYAEAVGGHLDADTVSFAEQRIASLLNMSTDDLLAVPGDLTSVVWVNAASNKALKLTLLAAAFADIANGQGKDVSAIINDYATAFNDNNGRLLQAGDTGVATLGNLLQSAINSGVLSHSPANADWEQTLTTLQSNVLSALPAGATFDSGKLLTALGPMGDDIRSVITASGKNNLEELVTSELAQFGWLASKDTAGVAGVAVQTVVYAVMGSTALGAIPPQYLAFVPSLSVVAASDGGGLDVVLFPPTKTMTIKGTTPDGMVVDLTLTLTALNAGSHANPFSFSAVGTVTNANVKATINGTLTIDPTTTDLSPLVNAIGSLGASATGGSTFNGQALLAAITGLLQSGHGVFTIQGTAALESLVNTGSTLSVDGKASLDLNMAGGANGAIAASGSVDHGTLALPNGDHFVVNPDNGDFLTFALGSGGSFSTQFSAYVLTLPQTVVTASGSLSALGNLLSSARDNVVSQLQAATLDLASILNVFVNFDYSQMHLTVNGQANILGSYQHVYKLALANGDLTITQPNSNQVAIEVSGSTKGLMVRAGTLWWVLGVDLSNVNDPALTVGDASGGEYRIDLTSLIAAVDPSA